MNLTKKIWLLALLFGIQAALQLISGALKLSNGEPYGEYGNAFAQAGIMVYIVYLLCTTRNKWAYWMAATFTGLALLRFFFGAALIMSSGIAPSSVQAILIALIVILFGIAPLSLLLNKELRAAYFAKV
jgi:hypothetical protein